MDIEDLRYEQLQEWLNTGKSESLPDYLVDYLEQLETVRSLYSKYEGKPFIINTLKNLYKLTEYKANKIYAEALNFFYSNNEVKEEAWANILADFLHTSALCAFNLNQYDVVEKLVMAEAKLRGIGKEKPIEIPKELYQRPITIYSMKPIDVGLADCDKRELAEFIDKLPDLTTKQRNKVEREAGLKPFKLFADDIEEVESNG